MKHVFVALIAACVFGTANAAQCPNGRSASVKDGHFAAKNLRAYNIMIASLVRDQTEDINDMVEAGTVIRLPTEQPACIVRDVATSFRTRITVPGHEGTYWVHASALDRSTN